MKKVKLFFLTTLLVIATIAVYAKKYQFGSYALYAYDASHGYCQLTATASFLGLTTSSTNSQITISNGVKTWSVYAKSLTGYIAVYITCP